MSVPDVSCLDVVVPAGADRSDRDIPRAGAVVVVSVLPAPVGAATSEVIGAALRLVGTAGDGERAAEASGETEAGAVDSDGASAVVIGLSASPLRGIAGGATRVTGGVTGAVSFVTDCTTVCAVCVTVCVTEAVVFATACVTGATAPTTGAAAFVAVRTTGAVVPAACVVAA